MCIYVYIYIYTYVKVGHQQQGAAPLHSQRGATDRARAGDG